MQAFKQLDWNQEEAVTELADKAESLLSVLNQFAKELRDAGEDTFEDANASNIKRITPSKSINRCNCSAWFDDGFNTVLNALDEAERGTNKLVLNGVRGMVEDAAKDLLRMMLDGREPAFLMLYADILQAAEAAEEQTEEIRQLADEYARQTFQDAW